MFLSMCGSSMIVQLVEHCSANAETTGSNPVETPKIFFLFFFSFMGYLAIVYIAPITTAMVTYSFHEQYCQPGERMLATTFAQVDDRY